MSLEDFFAQPELVLTDLQKTQERLHSARPKAGGARVRLAGQPQGAAGGGGVRVRHMALRADEQVRLMTQYVKASEDARAEIRRVSRVRLFAIVYARWRPGPAFGAGHTLDETLLETRVKPGGERWRDVLERSALGATAAGASWQEAVEKIAALARRSARLDMADGSAAGSAFLVDKQRLLTARHVVESPGWLFGNPPAPKTKAGWVRFNRVHGELIPGAPGVRAVAYHAAEAAALDAGVVLAEPEWRQRLEAALPEFSGVAGLPLQETALGEDELKGRLVAVVGHPLAGNQGGSPEDIPLVFGDAPLGLKRLMPGCLDARHPLGRDGEDPGLLRHDCSTLGGASGGCLLDLKTGRVLGIHVSGDSELKNRAVPAWSLAALLQ